MAIGPVSGGGIAVNIPVGKVVFWSALVQSSANQFIQLKDSGANVIFTTQGASSSGGTPTQIGQGFFQAADPPAITLSGLALTGAKVFTGDLGTGRDYPWRHGLFW